MTTTRWGAASGDVAVPGGGLHGVRVFLGAAVLDAGRGGIARVARMTARSLLDAGAQVDMLSLLDQGPVRVGGRAAVTARGSKPVFAARCHAAALHSQWFVYDSVGIARAHPRLPGLARPYAVWMHGIEVWEALRPATKSVLDRADLLLVNSRYTRDRYRALHPGGTEPQVCWLATEQDDEPEVRERASRAPTVLILSRIDASEGYKGHAELIASWPAVVAAVPEARLLIAGGGSGLAALRERVAYSPVRNNIALTGFVDEAGLPALWERADVLAMPSRGEGFGLVYAEAMRQGLPVVASVHDAGAEVNVDGETGFNVDLDSAEHLPNCLIRLLANEALRSDLGEAGRRRWRQHFRYSAFRNRLLTTFSGSLGGAS